MSPAANSEQEQENIYLTERLTRSEYELKLLQLKVLNQKKKRKSATITMQKQKIKTKWRKGYINLLRVTLCSR